MIQAIMLLQTAMMLLTTVQSSTLLPEDFRANAMSIANNAIQVANSEIAKLEAQVAQAQQQQATQQQLPTTQQKQSMKAIQVINPIPGKGLGNREYTAQPEVIDESNYIELGLIVLDENGKETDKATVSVTATDSSQNKTLVGTGNITPRYEDNGSKRMVPYYPFHYEFKTVGTHTITFESDGMTKSVTVEVGEADPA